jgi:hypothetical protein
MAPVNALSVVVRFHEGADINLLKRALYSLLDQTMITREVIVMVQFTDHSLLTQVRSLCEQLFEDGCCRVAGIEVAPGEDRRSQLLAEGVALADGRYVAFLDYDDMLFLRGVSNSIAACDEEGADLAIAQCLVALVKGIFPQDFIVAKERFVRKVPETPFALLHQNFVPICAFVVARAFLLRSGITFSSALTRLEDYEFLLRVLAAGRITLRPLANDIVSAQYNLNIDVGGTTLSKDLSPDPTIREQEAMMWEGAREEIRATLRSLRVDLDLMTIKGLLDSAANGEPNQMCLNISAFVRRGRDGSANA